MTEAANFAALVDKAMALSGQDERGDTIPVLCSVFAKLKTPDNTVAFIVLILLQSLA